MALFPRPRFSESTIALPIGTVDELRHSLNWFHDLFIATAEEELAQAQAAGSLTDPVIVVDGKRNGDPANVKPFGTIAFVETQGPMAEAIAATAAFVSGMAPVDTGFYVSGFLWLQNGNPVRGLPNADEVGVRGNVQLINRTPYAGWMEIEIPHGVIFGAYTFLSRLFGNRLNISYSYVHGDQFGGLISRPENPPLRPYAMPVLTIGGPASTVGTRRVRPSPTHGKKTKPGARNRWEGFFR